MSEPFLAEIKIVGFNFAPRGWAQCDGQILPINQNQSLYSLLGTTYGGDGRTSFALPDLRGRAPIHVESGPRNLGQKGGQETVVLDPTQIPPHRHMHGTGDQASDTTPEANVLASRPRRGANRYAAANNLTDLSGGPGATGGGQSHDNTQPSLALNFVIALQGLFPSRN